MSLSPRKRLWIAIGILVTIGLVTLLFYQNIPRYRWDENYLSSRQDPYSAHVIARLLEHRVGTDAFFPMTDSLTLPETPAPAANYVFIGQGLALDSAEVDQLHRFIRNGGTAFIASLTIPDRLLDPIPIERLCGLPWEDYYGFTDSAVFLGLGEPGRMDIFLQYRYRDEVRPYRWRYISPYFFCEEPGTPQALGYLQNERPNFARLELGEGSLFLHTTPLAFSNIALLDEANLAYAERALSFLADGPVYWDEWSKIAESVARARNDEAFSPPERRLSSESPLRYILQQPALTWAWYLLLALGLLHLLFRTKRRQRVQPLPEPNANTSLEFLDIISRLYFLQRDHRQLALLKTRLFRADMQQQYDLPGHQFDEDFVRRLARRARAPEAQLQRILDRYRRIEAARQIDERTLIDHQRDLEAFYQQRDT